MFLYIEFNTAMMVLKSGLYAGMLCQHCCISFIKSTNVLSALAGIIDKLGLSPEIILLHHNKVGALFLLNVLIGNGPGDYFIQDNGKTVDIRLQVVVHP